MQYKFAEKIYILSEAYRYKNFYDPDNTNIDRIGLQGDAMTVSVYKDNPLLDEDIKMFSQILSNDGEILGERFKELARLLKEMGYNGR